MLAIGIKNAILIILIILIIHFAIMNIMSNRVTPQKVQDKSQDKSQDKALDKVQEKALEQFEESTIKCSPVQNPSANLESEKENLLKFVFGDNIPKDGSGLDKFFKDYSNEIEKCDKPYEQCSKKSDDHSVPLATTCNPNIQELSSELDNLKKLPVCNTKKDLMILNQYDNENQMNGGVIYADINAYDNYDLSFLSY